MRVALITFRKHPLITSVDLQSDVLIEALAALNVHAEKLFWDDSTIDWPSFDLVVPLTCRDYSLQHVKFFEWVEACGRVTTILNPPAVLKWNGFKDTYLTELSAVGVPIVETVYFAPRTPIKIPDWQEFVVKPHVAAASRGAGRYLAADKAEALTHIEELQEQGFTALVQPYLPDIDAHGERALVYVEGRFVHAIHKQPVLLPGARPDQLRQPHTDPQPYEPSEAEFALAEQVLAVTPGRDELLYARVDMVSNNGQDPVLMELELIEPNIFLHVHPQSTLPVATAIANATRKAAAKRTS